jgi:UPF0271 protein
MVVRVDVNCDVGTHVGPDERGSDARVLPYVTSANVSAGVHAGDPHWMRETVQTAARHGVNVGVHPGLPDRIGHGLRAMDVSPREVADYVVYQYGALRGVARAAGVDVGHVKPHGALYTMLSDGPAYVEVLLEALTALGGPPFVAGDAHIAASASGYAGVVAVEGYVDMGYGADGRLVPAVTYTDPETVARRFVDLVVRNRVETVDGEWLALSVDTVCVHGGFRTAVDSLRAIHGAGSAYDVEFTGLDRLRL